MSRYLILVTDTRLDERTVAAVCKYNIACQGYADATLIVQKMAKASKMSTCLAKIFEMLVGMPVKKTNCATTSTSAQNIWERCGLIVDLMHNKSTTNRTSGVLDYSSRK